MCLEKIKTIGKDSLSFLLATLDLVTDYINAFDLLGYHVDFLSHSEEKSISPISEEEKTTWGYISLSIMFLPGVLIAIPKIFESLYRKEFLEAILSLLLMFTFPLILPSFLLMKIILIFIGSDCLNQWMEKMKPYRVSGVGAEAYYESFPQLVLQLYILLNNYNVTRIQKISILVSVVTITNNSILTDIEMRCHIKNESTTLKEKLKARIKKLPCYLTTVAFRAGSFALTIAYLREISIGTNLLLLIIMAIISYLRVSGRRNGEDKFSDAANYCFTNFGVMSVHGFGLDTEENEDGKRRQEEEDPTAITKFLRRTNWATFIYHTIILGVIMVLAYFEVWKNQEFFAYLDDDQLLLKPRSPTFYWMFWTTILMGCYSHNLLVYREEQLAIRQRLDNL